jgi:hypothetical protein
MIKSVLIFNNHGKPRLIKFYQQIVKFSLVIMSNVELIWYTLLLGYSNATGISSRNLFFGFKKT